jgi:hypothetical protein
MLTVEKEYITVIEDWMQNQKDKNCSYRLGHCFPNLELTICRLCLDSFIQKKRGVENED